MNELSFLRIFTLAGVISVASMFALAFVFGFVYRWLMRRFAKGTVRGRAQNIGSADRWLRAFIGLVVFVYAIATSWSPILLFFSGFCFFEAIFSWCGFNAAIGKNSCPL